MSYGRAKSDGRIDVDKVRWLAEILELNASPDELDALTIALSNQLSSINVLEKFDLSDVSPILKMDAKWHD